MSGLNPLASVIRFIPHIITENGIVKNTNYAFSDLTGIRAFDIRSKKIEEVLYNILKIPAYIHLEQNPGVLVETILFTKDLQFRSVSVQVCPTTFSDEKAVLFIENTGSRLDEKMIFLDRLIQDNHHAIGIFLLPEFILLKANEKMTEFLGLPLNNCIGKAYIHEIHELAGNTAEEFLDSLINREQTRHFKEVPHQTVENKTSYWDVTLSPIRENGKVTYVIATLYDETERVSSRNYLRKQTEIIHEQNKKLEAIFNNISDGLSVVDRDGNYIMVNQKVKDYFFVQTPTDTVGSTFCNTLYYDREGRVLTTEGIPATRVLKGEELRDFHLIMKQGENERHLSINGTPVFDEQGDLLFGVFSTRDITEAVRRQEQLIQSEREKNEALKKAILTKDEFLYTITHDFKTPLTVITSVLQAIDAFCGGELSEKCKSYLVKIRQNTFRQLRLVNNLLDIARMESGYIRVNKKNQDIVELTRSIVDSVQVFASQKKQSIFFSSSFECRYIGIDEEKYERILLNLLSNAIKYTPVDKSIHVKVYSLGRKICIEVKDEGVGIPREKQELIFQRYHRLDNSLSGQAEGTGLGLSLVKMLTEALGGQILVDSQPEEGSTFTLLLPSRQVQEKEEGSQLDLISDQRLVQSVAIEFSNLG